MPFDFTAVSAPFRMQPGLRRLAPGAPQLTPNHPGDPALREKLAVLGAHAERALLSSPGFDAAPALQALARHAAAEHPDAFSIDDGRWHARHLGWSLTGTDVSGDGAAEVGACLRALRADWRAAALLALAFAEDFAVIDGATAHIPWLAVCLPSHWAPQDKIGRHFAQVHAPVADSELLRAASDHLARLVTGVDRWERHVWTITRHPNLNQHPAACSEAPWPADASGDELVARAHFRTERQTFIPLPEHAQAIFTIHVEMQPLAQAITEAAQAQRVHDAITTMSPAVLRYRGLEDARDRLLDWLARRARA